MIRKSFFNDCSPKWFIYSLCIQLCLLNISKISKGHIGSLGERYSILDFFFFWKGGGYIQVVLQLYGIISLQNVMEKIINDSITLFLFDISKLPCSYFLYMNNIFLHQRLYWIVCWITFESNCIEIYVRLDLIFFSILVHNYVLYSCISCLR